MEGILDLGPQGELLFIEGLTRDSNPVVRIHCAIGLSMIGASTIRTLLVGLLDPDQRVRATVSNSLVSRVKISSIVETIQKKPGIRGSISAACRDILQNPIEKPDRSTVWYIEEILKATEAMEVKEETNL